MSLFQDFLAQKEFEIVNKDRADNFVVVFYYLLIPLGILTSILTILWIIQFICSYFYILKDGRPGYPFISYLLIFFQDHDVSFLSFAIFSILTLYLLFCVIKGNFKFGVRILCCWSSIYPMQKGKTYMNSFLFNISLILLGSMAITQFVSDCLSDYVAFTDVDALFNSIIKNLRFFKYFYRYHIFQYILFAVFVLSLIYLICRPTDMHIAPSKGKQSFTKGIDKEKNNNKRTKNDDKDTEDGNSQDKKLFDRNKKINKDSSEERVEKLDIDDNIYEEGASGLLD